MKKPIVLFLTCLILCLISSAQGGWKKKFYLNNSLNSTSQGVIETPSGNFIVIGLSKDTLNNKVYNHLTLIGTDNQGNFLWRKAYGNLNFSYLLNYFADYSAVCQDNNAFYFTGLVRDTAVREIGVLIKFDYNGDTLWQKIYREPLEDVIPQGIAKSVDGGLLITGWFQNWTDHSAPCMILKTDKNGKELWRKKIHKNTPDLNMGNGILQDSATKKIILTGYQHIGNSNSWAAYSNVLILNSLGNKILQTTFNNAGASSFLNVIQLKDKNFLTCGAWTDHYMNGDNFLNGFVVKFDISGNVIWSKKCFNPRIENGIRFSKELSNGEIVVIGQLDTYSLNSTPYQLKTVVIKLDRNGNKLSQNYVGYSSSSNISENPTSINQTNDGGFILSTEFPKMNNPTPFSIIKVDSSFCDSTTAWCTEVALGNDELKMLDVEWEMFPNPADEMINFECNPDSYRDLNERGGKNLGLKITDISGREIENKTLENDTRLSVNTSQYQTGIYFVTLYNNNKAIETKKLMIVR